MLEQNWKRAPIEIWDQILREASHWDPIPTSSSTLTAYLTFLRSDCRIFHEYLDVCKKKLELRLVCRSWGAVISRIPHDLVIVAADHRVWPSILALPDAKCIVTIRKLEYFCDHCYGGATLEYYCRTFTLPGFQDPRLWYLDDSNNLSSLAKKATIWLRFQDESLDHRHFSPTLPLQVLSSYAMDDTHSHLYLTPPRSTCLTHLHLGHRPPTSAPTLAGLLLPHLTYLCVTFFSYPTRSNSLYPFSTWSLPSLTTMIVFGGDCIEEEKEEIRKLIVNHAHNLVFLSLELIWWVLDQNGHRYYRWIGDEFDLFDKLSSLRVLGIRPAQFRKDCTYGSGTLRIPCPGPLTLYISDTYKMMRLYHQDAVLDKLLRWHRMMKHGFSRVALHHTWANVMSKLPLDRRGRSEYKARFEEFSERIIAAGIDVVDVNEVPFSAYIAAQVEMWNDVDMPN